MPYPTMKTLAVSGPTDGVLHVELARPQKMNALNTAFWSEFKALFEAIGQDTDTRVVVLSAQGKMFTCGLDLTDFKPPKGSDFARRAYHLRKHIMELQDSFTAMEEVPQPVITVTHGAVVGGGIDLLCAADIRYSSSDAFFTVKEVDVGLAADVGTLQRLPKIVGNEGWVKEVAYTSRRFTAAEAEKQGLITKVFGTKEAALSGAKELAALIAKKSPLAVSGTKRVLNHARDHSVRDGLEYVATWNMAMLQGPDMMKAAKAMMTKKTATFSKL